MKKSIISLVLTLCLAAGFAAMPVTAHAASNGKAIQPGTACVSDPDIANNKYDYLYFGGGNKWRVLDADHTNTGASGMFLLSEGMLGTTAFEAAQNSDDNDGQTKPNDWQYSDAQAWCEKNFYSIFTSAEQEAVISVSKSDSEAYYYNISWGTSSLNNEYLFFLSAQEAATYLGATDGAPGLVSSSYWWLRSPLEYDVFHAGFVHDDGIVDTGNVVYFGDAFSARPAFNLKLNSVLFTSAAEGGKASSGAVSAIPAYTGNAWKVTLLDSNRSGFSAKTSAINDNVLSVDYSGAGDGWISAMIADGSGAYTHYGQLAQSQGSGTVSVDLSGIDMSGKTLYIFNEQLNGDKKTDLSSRLVEVEIPASISNPYGVPSTGSHRDTGLMLTLALISGAVLVFSLRRKKEA